MNELMLFLGVSMVVYPICVFLAMWSQESPRHKKQGNWSDSVLFGGAIFWFIIMFILTGVRITWLNL